MKQIFIVLAAALILTLGCASSGALSESGQTAATSDRPAPIEIFVTKATGAKPVKVQIVNRTKKVLTKLVAELEFADTLADNVCKIEIVVIGSEWETIGDSRRVKLWPNATDLFEIDKVELNGSECWPDILQNWANVAIRGKIKKTEYIDS